MSGSYSYSYEVEECASCCPTSSPTPAPTPQENNCLALSPCEYPFNDDFFYDLGLNPEGVYLFLGLIALVLIVTCVCCVRKNAGRAQGGKGSRVKVQPGEGGGGGEIYSGKPTKWMQACTATSSEGGGGTRMVLDLKPCVFEHEGDLGMQIQMTPSGGTVVTRVNEGSEAETLGLRRGDIIRWPASGGIEAPYSEFSACIASGRRPLRFEVGRSKEAASNSPKERSRRPTLMGLKRTGEVDEETDIALNLKKIVDPVRVMKLNKAMKAFKQSDFVDGLMPVRVSAIKVYERIPDHNVGLNVKYDPSKIKKSGGYFETYSGMYNGIMAIKIERLILQGEEPEMAKALENWGRQTQLASKVNHPNILSLLSTCFEVDLTASLYEATTGVTLLDSLRNKNLQWRDMSLCSVMESAAEGMIYLHNNLCVAHGYLNPCQIQFNHGYQVKICDAFARKSPKDKDFLASHNSTFCYSSPNVLRGEECTIKDDIYSFGLILYCTTCPGGDAYAIMLADIQEEQMFPGIAEQVLSEKIFRKIRDGKLKLNWDKKCNAMVKALVLDCMEGKVDMRQVLKRLKEIRADVMKPYVNKVVKIEDTRKAKVVGAGAGAGGGDTLNETVVTKFATTTEDEETLMSQLERGEVGETRSATKVDKLDVASIESGDGGGSSEEDSEDDDDSDGSEMSL
ncbi:hypothetical protein TrVE_jg11495 [Triparma verrucosa]|uniref:Protein kinase domain-containing protein n=1 Tax=Triparma verrucosa TaxID=1606542 RepID=A0A9W7C3B2_9STRA|nr:hypothetical protein TrVE_jg11495 [Triparma verrucosa]